MANVTTKDSYNRFSKSNVQGFSIFTLLYISWISLSMGLRVEHLGAVSFLLITFFANKKTRNITLGFGFFIIYAILYDSLRVWPNHEFNPVHILEPFNLEKKLFGINLNGTVVIPGEYLFAHKTDIQSFISGVFYLTWVPFPLAFAFYLYFKNKKLLIDFGFTFLLTSLVGFVFYYLYPAAPPWYKIYYGTELDLSILSSAAGLIEFDRLVSFPLFENMYTRNSNVFAAIPSLHAAYPLVLLYFGIKNRVKWMSVVFFLDIIGIWFGAVYTLHHYIIDLLLGSLCAIIAIFVYEKIFNRIGKKTFLDTYTDLIRR